MSSRRDFFHGLLVGVISNAVWALIAGSAIIGATARWVHDLTEAEQASLYTLACVSLFLALTVAVYRFRRAKAAKVSPFTPETSISTPQPTSSDPAEEHILVLENEPATAPTEPTVPAESVNRLREVYEPFRRAMTFALEYLTADFEVYPVNGWGDDWRALVRRLLNDHVLPDVRGSLEDLHTKITAKGQFSQSQFNELVRSFHRALGQYYLLCNLLLWFGRLLLEGADYLRSQQPYTQWYRRHQESMAELRRVIGRDDGIGMLAEHLPFLERLLPEPCAAPPSPADAGGVFTSDGLEWSTQDHSARHGYKSGVTAFVSSYGSAQLPQPLILKVRCSEEPSEVSCGLLQIPADLRTNPKITTDIRGDSVYVELREPRLRAPTRLLVSLRGKTETPIEVERVERRTS